MRTAIETTIIAKPMAASRTGSEKWVCIISGSVGSSDLFLGLAWHQFWRWGGLHYELELDGYAVAAVGMRF